MTGAQPQLTFSLSSTAVNTFCLRLLSNITPNSLAFLFTEPAWRPFCDVLGADLLPSQRSQPLCLGFSPRTRHFAFPFSLAPADADSRIAFSRSVGVSSCVGLALLTAEFLFCRKARPMNPNATKMAPPIISNSIDESRPIYFPFALSRISTRHSLIVLQQELLREWALPRWARRGIPEGFAPRKSLEAAKHCAGSCGGA